MFKGFLQLVSLTLIIYFVLPVLVPGISIIAYQSAVVAAILFSLINIFLRPLLRIVTLPLNLLTLGLFGFFVNVLLFWVVTALVPGIEVADFLAAVFGAIVLTLSHRLLEGIYRE